MATATSPPTRPGADPATENLTPREIRDYFEQMTSAYLQYGGQALSFHVPLMDESTHSKEDAFFRSNRFLADGCSLRSGQRVLDAGCGVGGLVLFLAQHYGVHATGITLSQLHAGMGARFAEERGLSHLAQFKMMDYMDMEFVDGTFDFVFNQDSFCHAPDPEVYLQEVRRVLKRGGQWRCIDAFKTANGEANGPGELDHVFREGWRVSRFASWVGFEEMLRRSGFEDVQSLDLRPWAFKGARAFVREWIRHGIVGLAASGEQEQEPNPVMDSHMAACAAFGSALIQGDLTYRLVTAVKS